MRRYDEDEQSRAEQKKKAKTLLSGNWAWAAIVCFVPIIIIVSIFFGVYFPTVFFLEFLTILSDNTFTTLVAIFLVLMMLVIQIFYYVGLMAYSSSTYSAFLDFIRGQKKSPQEAMAYGFKKERLLPFLKLNLLIGLYCFLWSLLLFVPGIIKAFSYSQSVFLLKDKLDNEQPISIKAIINESRDMMEGHKWEYFVLQMSFMGWWLLCPFTLGLGYIWLIPYMHTTNALYYQELQHVKNGLPNHDYLEKTETVNNVGTESVDSPVATSVPDNKALHEEDQVGPIQGSYE